LSSFIEVLAKYVLSQVEKKEWSKNTVVQLAIFGE